MTLHNSLGSKTTSNAPAPQCPYEKGRPILTGKIPSTEGTEVCPSFAGATNWYSPSYNPDQNRLYFLVLIVSVHVPLVTAYTTWGQAATPGKYSTLTVGNSLEVLPLFDGHNVVAVLQGHLHINEIVTLKGIQFITGGAVCGNWWRGARMGVPEGFTVVSARNGSITTRYEPYGFKAIASPEK